MSTETADDGGTSHIRSITVTSLAAMAGVVAAFVSDALTAGDPAGVAATDTTAQLVVLVAIVVQFPLLRLAGIDPDGIGAKDVLYVAFLTFSMWFVTWGILLTATGGGA
ncbi:hypothetical protein BRD17_09155 [Halobacteriales archaeon SW_7_68_16]|nr:MAG: hypothetical protein BRD17_09155 [Halobacteriales archaeon SW_7_68_16]